MITKAANIAELAYWPSLHPALTWGLGRNGLNNSPYAPGPGGPVPDARPFIKTTAPGPVFGRVGVLSCLRAFGPTVGVFRPWLPIAPYNNAWAPAVFQQYVPGWYKLPPTPMSGF